MKFFFLSHEVVIEKMKRYLFLPIRISFRNFIDQKRKKEKENEDYE